MSKKALMTPAALAAAALILAAGCAGPEQQETPDSQQAKPYKIAGIVFQEDQFFRLIQFGMRDAGERLGAEILESNSMGKPDEEIKLVNTYIARGVDAIVVSPLSAKASRTALKRAKDKGIVVVTYNTNVEGDVPAAYIESNQFDLGVQTGKAAAKYIQEKLGGKAKIAVLAFRSQNPEQSNARSGGFKQEMARLPGVEIVTEQDAWLADQAKKSVDAILTAHPDIDLIWAANEGGTVGSVLSVKGRNKAGEIVVFGTDTSEQLIAFLLSDEGILQAVTGQKPFEMGVMAVEAAIHAVISGHKRQPAERKVSMPGILLTREDADGVRAFQTNLQEMMARNQG